ncbi:hypothetical protein ACTMU2_24375 [Cupriavidus basilensis]
MPSIWRLARTSRPKIVGAGLQVAGIAWQLYAKAFSLRFSFGILPANRGIVSERRLPLHASSDLLLAVT